MLNAFSVKLQKGFFFWIPLALMLHNSDMSCEWIVNSVIDIRVFFFIPCESLMRVKVI